MLKLYKTDFYINLNDKLRQQKIIYFGDFAVGNFNCVERFP